MVVFNIGGGCKPAEQFLCAVSVVRNRDAPFLLCWVEFYLLVLTLINFPLIRLPVRFSLLVGFFYYYLKDQCVWSFHCHIKHTE